MRCQLTSGFYNLSYTHCELESLSYNKRRPGDKSIVSLSLPFHLMSFCIRWIHQILDEIWLVEWLWWIDKQWWSVPCLSDSVHLTKCVLPKEKTNMFSVNKCNKTYDSSCCMLYPLECVIRHIEGTITMWLVQVHLLVTGWDIPTMRLY